MSAADDQIVVRAAAGTEGVGAVNIVSDTGARVSLVNAWTYVDPIAVTGASPSSGHFGTRVTISGTALLGGTDGQVTQVTLAGSVATVDGTPTQTEIMLIAAAFSTTTPTLGDIRVDTASGAFTVLADAWTYAISGSVSAVYPSSGQYATVAAIVGINLFGGGSEVSSVTLGGVPAFVEASNPSVIAVIAAASDVTSSTTGNVGCVS